MDLLECEIGAQHVEGAVREVHDLEDAEDQSQPGGNEEEQHSDNEAACPLCDQARTAPKAGAQSVKVQDAFLKKGLSVTLALLPFGLKLEDLLPVDALHVGNVGL